MVQGRCGAGLLLEAALRRIDSRMWRQNLDGKITAQTRISSAVDLAHTSAAKARDYFVRTKPGARSE
jgi:hypothetical protein